MSVLANILTLYVAIIAALYVIIILLLFVGACRVLSNSRKFNNNLQAQVSVVVAFRNEAKNLPALIEALKNQTLQSDNWEAIFVDDNSIDNGARIVQAAADNIRYIKLDGVEGKKHAIIAGVAAAKYNVVALTDADCIPATTWLQSVLANINDNVLVQGSVNIGTGSNRISSFESLDYASLMATSAGSFGLNSPIIASAANMAFCKNLLEVNAKTLNLHYKSGDDMFLLHTAKQRKLKMAFIADSNADVTTYFEGGFAQMIQRRKRWASKATGYTDMQTIVVALVVFLFNFNIVCLFILAALGFVPFLGVLWLLMSKLIVDILLLFKYLSHKNQQRLLLYYLPLQIIYPFYNVFASVCGLLSPIKWK